MTIYNKNGIFSTYVHKIDPLTTLQNFLKKCKICNSKCAM